MSASPVSMTYLYSDSQSPTWPCDADKLARAVRTMVEAANHPWNSFKLVVGMSDGTTMLMKPKKRRA